MTCERAPPATAVSCGSATGPTSSSAPPRPKPGPPRSGWFPGSMTAPATPSAAGPWTPSPREPSGRTSSATSPMTTATPNRTCGPASAVRALARARPSSVTPIRCSPRSAPTQTSAWTLSSCPATRTPPKPTCSPGMCYHTSTTHRSRAEPAPPTKLHVKGAASRRLRSATRLNQVKHSQQAKVDDTERPR